MRITNALVVSVFLIGIAAAPFDEGGFTFEGDRIEDAKLTFNPKGLDRSTAESTSEALLRVRAQIMSDATMEARYESLRLEASKRYFSPVMTETAMKDLFAEQDRLFKMMKEKKDLFKSSHKVTLKKKEDKDGTVSLRYEVATSMSRPCRDCSGDSKEDCKSCEGKGVESRDQKSELTVLVVKKEAEWRVKGLYRGCSGCDGTGKCRDHQEKDCFSCKGDKVCGRCEGKGMSPDSFMQGPRAIEDMPKIEKPSEDFSAPEKTMQSLLDRVGTLRALTSAMEDKMSAAYRDFIKFFMEDPDAIKQKSRKYRAMTFKLGETKKGSDTEATILYGQEEGVNSFKADLVKDEKGVWRVDSFHTRCWMCDGTGKGDAGECDSCKGTGFSKSTRFPH